MERMSSSAEPVIETLKTRGWCFGDDLDQVNGLVVITSALVGDGNTCKVADSVESELLNMDIRSVGARSLPDPAQLRRLSHLEGPKILQINSVRDITRSSIEDLSGSSSSRRLLKMTLTDGHSEITGIEYSHIPAIPNDVVPGTKLRLEHKVAVRDGLICLTAEVVTLLGGMVQRLYEEWQMKKKYSGFSRSSGRVSQENENAGPPPFEELQIEKASHHRSHQGFKKGYIESRSKDLTHTEARATRNNGKSTAEGQPSMSLNGDGTNFDEKALAVKERNDEKPSSSDTRPKQVVEAAPVQNPAAAQKLLEKMKQPGFKDRQPGGRARGKGRQEEPVVFTLEEWEKRKVSVANPVGSNTNPSDDEDLAKRLQKQFDLEDSRVQTDAEDIRMSMFNYDRRDDHTACGSGRQGRGRGGRRRGGGRGRRG